MHHFLCLFSRFFSLSLINQFDYDFPRNGFLCIYPSWVTEVPESVNVYPSLNLRYFQPLFLQRSFSPAPLSLSFPPKTQVTRKLDLLILPHWPLRLCICLWGFIFHFFTFSSDWIISMGQSSSSLILSFITYTLLLSSFNIL